MYLQPETNVKTALKVLLASCLLAALTGCGGVAGHWKLESIQPETAKGSFDLAMLCLGKDGACCAAAREGDQVKRMTGTYKYDRAAKTLTLSTEGGPERVYQAQVLCPGTRLKVWSDTPGKEWTAMMSKATCCGGKRCGDPKCCCHRGPGAGKPCAVSQCPMMKKDDASKTQGKPDEAKTPAASAPADKK
jgi:hypothetical protein